MNVEVASICDAATDQAGKLNILGAFDRFALPLPYTYPQCSAVFRIRYQRSEATHHQFELTITNTQGQNLIPPLQSDIQFPALNPEAETGVVNMILNMHRIQITKEGKYLIRLRVNQIEIALLPLYIFDTTPKEPNPLEFENK
ncbi:MAG: hypothetical protein GX116_04850 [Fibrobacter sp.]|jgi:hypothetical protein|nr:hypothetical protein [Fibrobacter sp.]